MQAEGTKEKWRYASSKSRSKGPKGNGDMQAAKRVISLCCLHISISSRVPRLSDTRYSGNGDMQAAKRE